MLFKKKNKKPAITTEKVAKAEKTITDVENAIKMKMPQKSLRYFVLQQEWHICTVNTKHQ